MCCLVQREMRLVTQRELLFLLLRDGLLVWNTGDCLYVELIGIGWYWNSAQLNEKTLAGALGVCIKEYIGVNIEVFRMNTLKKP